MLASHVDFKYYFYLGPWHQDINGICMISAPFSVYNGDIFENETENPCEGGLLWLRPHSLHHCSPLTPTDSYKI